MTFISIGSILSSQINKSWWELKLKMVDTCWFTEALVGVLGNNLETFLFQGLVLVGAFFWSLFPFATICVKWCFLEWSWAAEPPSSLSRGTLAHAHPEKSWCPLLPATPGQEGRICICWAPTMCRLLCEELTVSLSLMWSAHVSSWWESLDTGGQKWQMPFLVFSPSKHESGNLFVCFQDNVTFSENMDPEPDSGCKV